MVFLLVLILEKEKSSLTEFIWILEFLKLGFSPLRPSNSLINNELLNDPHLTSKDLAFWSISTIWPVLFKLLIFIKSPILGLQEISLLIFVWVKCSFSISLSLIPINLESSPFAFWSFNFLIKLITSFLAALICFDNFCLSLSCIFSALIFWNS